MSLIKYINDIINKNKLVFAFILGLLTCYLILNCGSCKEGYEDYCECIRGEGEGSTICEELRDGGQECFDLNISTKKFDV